MKRQVRTLNPARRSRRGAAMVFGLVALLVTSSIVATLLRTTSLSHRQFKREENRAQARLLADAGIARALSKLRTQSDFTGEVWKVTDDQLSAGRTAVVQLKVSTDSQDPDQQVVSVVSEYPVSQPDVVKISRELRIPKAH